MERVTEILIQYAQADLSQRIPLFLQYPDLRDVFGEIERAEYYCLKGFSNAMGLQGDGKYSCSSCYSV